MTDDPIRRLVAATERRLWRAAVQRRIPVAAWLAGLCPAAFGLLALLTDVRPSAALVAGTTVAIFLAGLAPALLARPSRREAALHLDRHFASHALLTTALESGSGNPTSPAAEAVRRRATEAAREWYAAGGYRVAQPSVAAAALGLVPAFVGVLLLQYAAIGQPTPSVAAAGSPATGTARTANALHAAGADAEDAALRDLRRSLRSKAETGAAGGRDEGALEQDPRSAVPEQAVVATGPDDARQEIAAPPDETGGLAAGTSGDDGAEAGTARPGDADTMSEETGSAVAALGRDVARAGAARATGTAAEDGYAPGRTPGLTPTSVRPAAAPPATGAWSTMTAAQAAYARRYLEDTGARDD